MEATSINITDMYMSILSSLTEDEKLDLISKLLDSLRKKKKASANQTEEDIFACFTGDWTDFNPERTFNRNVETW